QTTTRSDDNAFRRQRLPHQRDCPRQIALHQRSWNAQDPVPSPTEFDIAASVSRTTLSVVGITIDLDDERDLASEEIDDVIADDLLPAKGHPETLAANGGKQESLRVGRVVQHVAGTSLEKSALFLSVDEHGTSSARRKPGLCASPRRPRDRVLNSPKLTPLT